MLSDQQIERYSRQIILPEVGGVGQEKLLRAKVAVLGDSELSATAALYLAAAGVGRLTVSQACHDLSLLNPDCSVQDVDLCSVDLLEVVWTHDVVIAERAQGDDAGDVLQHVNALCVAERKPLLWGASTGATGYMAWLAGEPAAPCYECLRPYVQPVRNSDACALALSEITAAFVGTELATEALKELLDIRGSSKHQLTVHDLLRGGIDRVDVPRNPECGVCAGYVS